MKSYSQKTIIFTCVLLLSLISATIPATACFSQTTSCEGQSVSQGDGGSTDYWYDDLVPPPHSVHLGEGTEWIINVHGGGGCSDYEHLTVTDEEEPPGWTTTITMGTIYNTGDEPFFYYVPSHKPVLEGDDIEDKEIYIGRTWDFDIIYNVTNIGSPMDCLDQICEVFVAGFDPDNQHDYVYVHTTTHIIDSYPLVTVLTPNGGESWGGTHDITWDAVDDQPWPPNPIDIYYSTSGTGGPWNEINGGSYSHEDDDEEEWVLPSGVESEDCYVKVEATDAKGQSSHDISDTAFEIDTIPPTVEGTDPEDDEGEVPISKDVVVMFSEPMDPSTVTITQTDGTDPGGWEWTWTPCHRQVTGTHDNWDYGEEVEMTISANYADDTNPGNANPDPYVWNFFVTAQQVDLVVIEDEPGGTGDAIMDQTIPVGFTIQGWAAGYNSTTGDYIGDVHVNWLYFNYNGSDATTSPSTGTTSTFDAGDMPGDATWKICDGEGHQYEVDFHIVVPGVDQVIIRDAPNNEGNPIEDQTINVDTEVVGYSAAYNDTYGYIGDINTNWNVENSDGAQASTSPAHGSSSTFDSGTFTGTAVWRACDGEGHWDTVTFTIVAMVDYIRIEYYEGEEIGDVTMTTDDTLDCYARAYNNVAGLLGDIAVNWTVIGEIGYVSPAQGTMTTFYAETVGSGHIHACDGNYHTDTTGTITVTHGECCSITLSPVQTTVTSDLSQQYTATCCDEDGNEWEGVDGTWSETDPKGTITGTGRFYAGKMGTWTIKYTEDGITGTTKVTVEFGSPTSIRMEPETWSGTADDTVTFTVIGIDSDGNERDVTEFTTFTTDDPSGDCAYNIYHPAEAGDWEVTGTFHSLTASTSVNVDAGDLYEIVIEDEDGDPIDGSSIILGQSFDAYARGYDEDGNLIGDIYASWESDDSSVCTVGSNKDTSTEITVIGPGPCTISAEKFDISGFLILSVPSDSDSDGLADKWELENFGNLYSSGTEDPDNDGISNLDEYLAGTDPMAAEQVKEDDFSIYLLIFIIVVIAIVGVVVVAILATRKK